MNHTLSILWACFDTTEPEFSASELASWPAADRKWLLEAGVLKETSAATLIACPSCEDGHVEEVLELPESAPRRFFIPCPDAVRVEIDLEGLRRWTVDVDTVAELIAGGLALTGPVKPVEPGRLWRLGTTRMGQSSREVVLFRQPDAEDGARIAAHIGQTGRPIVLFAGGEPPPSVWPGRTPACVALSRVLSHNGTGLQVDPFLLHDLVSRADDLQSQTHAIPIDPKSRKLVVRRQLKAELTSHLEDSNLVAAYRQHGSMREAATALTKERGKPVTKDMVQRAVTRAGGAKAVLNSEDSESVTRTVASHRRDKGGRF
ncbi:hypothetical protein PHYC_01314 [Phycisphaerales bacterium]|nr:hypothetical protein PHYC_01314 [Phycisphaerales bacterium]